MLFYCLLSSIVATDKSTLFLHWWSIFFSDNFKNLHFGFSILKFHYAVPTYRIYIFIYFNALENSQQLSPQMASLDLLSF